ncbi:MAG: adenine deaminase [Planctomycetota bacterium]
MSLNRLIDVAAGREPADVLFRNGRIVVVFANEVVEADVAIADHRIAGVGAGYGNAVRTVDLRGRTLVPGLIDAHLHIESTLLGVAPFADIAAACGTAAVITDPHEIANVLGVDGMRYMINAADGVPLDVYFMASSCVPASGFESPHSVLSGDDLEPLLKAEPRVLGLAEMMNFPGVIHNDPDVHDKIRRTGDRLIDGHAPGLSGQALNAYAAAGIHSEHECTTRDEAAEKLSRGLRIMIREGSQARNLEALLPLVRPDTAHRFMFCTDDKDVEDLLDEGHIDHMVRRAIALGLDPVTVVRVACCTAADAFGLRHLGGIAPGRAASFAIVDDLSSFRVLQTWHNGRLVADEGQRVVASEEGVGTVAKAPSQIRADSTERSANIGDRVRQTVNAGPITSDRFRFQIGETARTTGGAEVPVHTIVVLEDRIDTERGISRLPVSDGPGDSIAAQPDHDLLKIAVLERHHATGRTGVGFVRGFGFSRGAIASTVAHDAHNLVVVGADDRSMATAANRLAAIGGGFCVAEGDTVVAEVPLPIAGLMSDAPAEEVRSQMVAAHAAARDLGGTLRRPFMALSFLSLSVIGRLKLTDQGLVDVDRFALVDVVANEAAGD